MDENYQLTRLQVPENKYDDRYIYHFGLCWVFWEGWVYKCEQKNEGQTDKNRLGREEWKGTLRTAQRKKNNGTILHLVSRGYYPPSRLILRYMSLKRCSSYIFFCLQT